jgi:hypothetical protein
MTDIIRERLVNQQLASPRFRRPEAIVAWFGGIQAQDFSAAKWAIGLRAAALTDAAVQRAFDDGRILRTHVLRPTWHFVTASDIRWLIALSGPRLQASLVHRQRWLGLDAPTLVRSRRLLARALGSGPLTRRELGAVLERGRIRTTPERLSHLMADAELEGIICSGPVRDRQFTYALMDDRAPRVPTIRQDEALARLAERYFRSHGPATLPDFAWWSGLPLREAKRAVEIAGTAVSREAVLAAPAAPRRPSRSAGNGVVSWLLPNFDEYLVAYKDRSAVFGHHSADPPSTLGFTVIVDGLAIGAWSIRRRSASVSIGVVPWTRLTRRHLNGIRAAAERYSAFLGSPVAIAPGRGHGR